jgi:hypothetical protein
MEMLASAMKQHVGRDVRVECVSRSRFATVCGAPSFGLYVCRHSGRHAGLRKLWLPARAPQRAAHGGASPLREARPGQVLAKTETYRALARVQVRSRRRPGACCCLRATATHTGRSSLVASRATVTWFSCLRQTTGSGRDQHRAVVLGALAHQSPRHARGEYCSTKVTPRAGSSMRPIDVLLLPHLSYFLVAARR